MDYWATEEATKKLMSYLECGSEEELFKRLHIDRVITVEPRYTGPSLSPAIIFKQLVLQKILSLCMKQDTNTDGINSPIVLDTLIERLR